MKETALCLFAICMFGTLLRFAYLVARGFALARRMRLAMDGIEDADDGDEGKSGGTEERIDGWKPAKELQAIAAKLADSLVLKVDELEKWARRWKMFFHNYSFGNIILAAIQKPDFTIIAGRNAWEALGRKVNEKATPIYIFAPQRYMVGKIMDAKKAGTCAKCEKEFKEGDKILYVAAKKGSGKKAKTYCFFCGNEMNKSNSSFRRFRTVTVFDISDTSGPPVSYGNSDMVKASKERDLGFFFEVVREKMCPVEYVQGIAGSTALGMTDHKKIAVVNSGNWANDLVVLFHEMAHFLLHGTSDVEDGATLSRSVREVEAEAVAYIVGTYFEVDSEKARYYIQHWGGDKTLLESRGMRIIKCAEKIIGVFEPKQRPSLVSENAEAMNEAESA